MNALPRLIPRRLRPGDTIGIVAPAGPDEKELLPAAIHWLEEQGYRVKTGLSATRTTGYLAGPDELRAADMNAMFAAADIAGIICLRGGYGAMRLLELVDYALIRANPKVFVGYSDITALHLSIGQRTGLVTFHGPMAVSDIAAGLSDYTAEAFWAATTAASPLGLLTNPPDTPLPAFIIPGRAEGCLTGGNLSLIAATLGTPYEIDTSGKILCLEEVGEAPYRIDRMLTQLLLAGKLQAAAGLVLAVWAGCDSTPGEPDFTIEEVLADRLSGLAVPVLTNLFFGHTTEKLTLPLGVKARLDPAGLTILEPALIP